MGENELCVALLRANLWAVAMTSLVVLSTVVLLLHRAYIMHLEKRIEELEGELDGR